MRKPCTSRSIEPPQGLNYGVQRRNCSTNRTNAMPTVFIPPLLKPITGGIERIEMEAGSVREVVEQLESQFPGVRNRLCEGDELKPGLTVAVDGNVSPLGLLQKLKSNSEVHFLPAIGGG